MPIRRVRWSPHARDRLTDRPELTRETIEDVLLQPDRDEPAPTPTKPDRRVAQKFIDRDGRRYLARVFYDPQPRGTASIVSFYLTSRFERYLKGPRHGTEV